MTIFDKHPFPVHHSPRHCYLIGAESHVLGFFSVYHIARGCCVNSFPTCVNSSHTSEMTRSFASFFSASRRGVHCRLTEFVRFHAKSNPGCRTVNWIKDNNGQKLFRITTTFPTIPNRRESCSIRTKRHNYLCLSIKITCIARLSPHKSRRSIETYTRSSADATQAGQESGHRGSLSLP